MGWWVTGGGENKKENKFQHLMERRNSETARSKGASLDANQDKSMALAAKRSHWDSAFRRKKGVGERSHRQGSSPALVQQATVASCLSPPLT